MTKRKLPAPIRDALRHEFYEPVLEVLRTARCTAKSEFATHCVAN